MVRLTDRPDVTLDVYRGRKTQHYNNNTISVNSSIMAVRCILFFFIIIYRNLRGFFYLYFCNSFDPDQHSVASDLGLQ